MSSSSPPAAALVVGWMHCTAPKHSQPAPRAAAGKQASKEASRQEKEKNKGRWEEIARFPNSLSSQVGTLSRRQASRKRKRARQCGRRGRGFQDEGEKV